ncbi:matrix metalloproteinase-25 [Anguilla anguilla]|uniref:Peptidase metallopeptidase domain-containing protein n=2 Tax=Anguilla anguilla TaxID=7936 RepID=A0A9D3MVM1_ANGAN|nr:matrix metalloproteinase-25 [Anguilla anguilla]KAG5854706.1 hypothetical protein ANANG_G00040640 [Anguilla anguilla]
MVYQVLCLTGTMMVFMSVGLSIPVPHQDQHQYSRGVDWLSRYGYLPPANTHTGRLQTREGIEKGLRQMQRFAGLKETGKLDEDTLALMATPRCSLPDIVGPEDMLKKRRRKRYALSGLRWDKTDITWSVHSFPTIGTHIQSDSVNPILAHALKVWSDVTPLSFHYLSETYGQGAGQGGDIRVSFSRSFHDDGYPFDGIGGTLAHAFFPGTGDIAGDTHFDDEEIWSYGGNSGSTDLFAVAVHEFGHALGLSHSSSDPSIMRPYYQGPVGDIAAYKLPMDDRLAIQTLYGVRKASPTRPPGDVPGPPRPPLLPSPDPPRPTQKPNHSLPNPCNGSFDAVAHIRGEIFLFKGPYFWRIQQSGSSVSLSPALIWKFWIGIPPGIEKVDAVYERKSDSHIIFFIGNQYWVFNGATSLPGYPHPLSEWTMRSRDGYEIQRVEAAFVWDHNGKTYLFSGRQFWRFDEGRRGMERKLDGDYPKDATLWGGVPPDPDDIFSWKNGDTYFFKGNSYWMLKQGGINQEAVASKSIAVDWMRCAPSPTAAYAPAKPRNEDCSCTVNRALTLRDSNWIMLLSIILIFCLSQIR